MIPDADGLLCRTLVGRRAELALLEERLAAASAGDGRVVSVAGEAGVGKSRLVAELVARARTEGMPVLTGRATPAASPYRPLSEALLPLGRERPVPDDTVLAPFTGHLARLVPSWGTPASDASPLMTGEALIRLLRGLAAPAVVVVLEDLHWADPETLAVVDYLAGAVPGEPILCVTTTRPVDGRGIEQSSSRSAAEVIDLLPLGVADQRTMLTACLGPEAAARVAPFVAAHSDGVPFLVEELLAGLASTGHLRREGDRWTTHGTLTPSVPASLAQSVEQRLAGLDATARRVVDGAAVLGRIFDWSLLPGVTGCDGSAVVTALRAALSAQLVTVDGQDFRFRHALTREAVLSGLLPPERQAFAAAAVAAVVRAHPGLPDPWLDVAAAYALDAGEVATASELLTRSARRALERGAIASALETADRAVALCDSAETSEMLVDALVQAGDVNRARHVAADLLPRLDPAGAARAHAVLVRACLAAGDAEAAATHLAAARAGADPALCDVLAAQLALETGRPEDARHFAAAAAASEDPEIRCDALLLLARVVAQTEVDAGMALHHEAMAVAEAHGLGAARLRALQELTLLRTVEEGPPALDEARPIAEEAGALVMVAQLDLLRAELAVGQLDAETGELAARRCIEASRRFGLASLPVALVWLACVHALRGDATRLEDALDQATSIDPGDARLVADGWGRARATYHAVREERAELRAALAEAARHTRRAPHGRSMFIGRLLRAVVEALDGTLEDAAAARAEVAGTVLADLPIGRIELGFAEAIVLGRQGCTAEAAAACAAARAELAARPAYGDDAIAARLTAEAAVRDGWGDPVPWLRELEASLATRGYDRVARACRDLLVRAGAPAPRRGRGSSTVPPRLRALGVTSRELDVLTLVAEGLGNREIAERLVLSVRTVEGHVATLLRRTGTATRAELAAALTP